LRLHGAGGALHIDHGVSEGAALLGTE